MRITRKSILIQITNAGVAEVNVKKEKGKQMSFEQHEKAVMAV